MHRLPDVLVDVLIHFEVVEVLFEFVSEPIFWTSLFRVMDDLGAGKGLGCSASCTFLSLAAAAPLARSPERLLGKLGSVFGRGSLKLVRGCVTGERKRCSSLRHQGRLSWEAAACAGLVFVVLNTGTSEPSRIGTALFDQIEVDLAVPHLSGLTYQRTGVGSDYVSHLRLRGLPR
jgi:hypothetical protein